MRIEVWADVVCPWMYIGKRRLERALAGRGGEPVEVVWRPYRIDPTAPAEATPRAGLLTDPDAREALRECAPGLTPEENRDRVADEARAEGLGPRWGAVWRASSHDAHRLIALALDAGGARLQDAVVEAVLRAHFVEGLDISDREVLGRISDSAGFPSGGALLDDGAGEEQVRELLLRGKAMGVRTSPTYVAAGLALAGAQPAESIAALLRDAEAAGEPRRLPEEVERLRHAEALLDVRDPLGALTLLRPLLADHGDDPNVRLLAARAYYASAQLGRARGILEQLVADAPDDAYARLLLGRTLERQGLPAEAAPHLRMAAAMVPDYG
ncbi:DsbA family protein [Streptomyces sp. NPDC059506]|uniref:DsbA family oxidoreductase n=1 Tax=Streptomyces sp. NPDC059506 TaxID=3347751 RepID=UPI0036A2F0FD